MLEPVIVRQFHDNYGSKVRLEWIAGKKGAERSLQQDDDPGMGYSHIGFLNLVRPYRIQVLGTTELEYLAGLGKNSQHDALSTLFTNKPAMIVIVDAARVPSYLVAMADEYRSPLFQSALSGHKFIDLMQYYLSREFSRHTYQHGVFLDIMGCGVLLCGPSGIGKSELALELLTRGHRLIADDAIEFTQTGPDVITGRCPALLQGFMEVRGLGILNICAMYGENAVMRSKTLQLIIRMLPIAETDTKVPDRLGKEQNRQQILELEIPELVLPVGPGRNLAVIVETAVRNQALLESGYNAADDFIRQHQKSMQRSVT